MRATKKLAALLFAAALLAVSSCSMEDSSGVGFAALGRISFALPSGVPAPAGSDVSAAISSGGSWGNHDLANFKVVVRNLSLNKELSQMVSPGSTVTIDALEPGSWDVAIFGYGESVSPMPSLYGAARGIAVVAGQTSYANVSVRWRQPITLNLSLEDPGSGSMYADGRSNVDKVYVEYSCAEFKDRGSCFLDFNMEEAHDQPEDSFKLLVPLECFVESAYNYTFKVVLFDSFGRSAWEGNVPAQRGGAEGFSGSLAFADKCLEPAFPAESFPRVFLGVNDNFAEYMQELQGAEREFSVVNRSDGSNTPVSCSSVTAKPLAKDYCGNVPVLFEYGDMLYASVFGIRHISDIPSISVSDQNIPVGVTRKVVATVTPSAPKEYPVFDCPSGAGVVYYDSYGFAQYGDYGATDLDNWTNPAFTAASGSPSGVITIDGDEFSAVGVGGPYQFKCVVKVTNGPFGYLADDIEGVGYVDAEGLFEVTVVETTSGGGGGSGGGGSGTWSVTVNNGVNMGMIYTTESSFNFYLTNSAYTTTADYEAVNLTNLFTFNLQDAPNQNPPVTSKVTTGDDGNPRLCVTYPKTSGGNTYFPSGMASCKFTVYDKTSGESVCECSIMFMDGGGNTLSGEWSAYMKSTTITQGGNVDIYIKNTAASSYADYQNSSFSSHFKYFFSGVSGVKKAGSNNPTEDDSVWVIKESFENPFGSSATGEQTITVKYDDDVIETFTVTIE